MQSFWSSVDDKSELKNPGVHITIGGDWVNFTCCASICLNGKRYVYHPSVLIEGVFVKKEKGGKHEYDILSHKFTEVSDKVKTYITQKVYNVVAWTGYKLPAIPEKTVATTSNLKLEIEDLLWAGVTTDEIKRIVDKVESELLSYINF